MYLFFRRGRQRSLLPDSFGKRFACYRVYYVFSIHNMVMERLYFIGLLFTRIGFLVAWLETEAFSQI